VEVESPRLARIIRRCRDLPGQNLFEYLDEDGSVRQIGSQDVNDYLREISGVEITAKDFRTWAATNLSARILAKSAAAARNEKKATKKVMLEAVGSVARSLGNTPAICRKCYIHPAIFEGYFNGSLVSALRRPARKAARRRPGISAEEAAVVAFLRSGQHSLAHA
jgi:DNA topoisomerase-1